MANKKKKKQKTMTQSFGLSNQSADKAYKNLSVQDTLTAGRLVANAVYANTVDLENLELKDLTVEQKLILPTFHENSVLFVGPSEVVTEDVAFTWTASTDNLQVGTVGVSIGVSAGLATQSVAIGSQAGQTSQAATSVAIGNLAGALSQQLQAIAIGDSAGQTFQGAASVAIGASAGRFSQNTNAVALGPNAARTSQGANAVAIGFAAGSLTQGPGAVAIGISAGTSNQGQSAVALGNNAGSFSQGFWGIAVGLNAGMGNQATNAIAIGPLCGTTNQREAALAIGFGAGNFSQATLAIAIGQIAGQTSQATQSIAIGTNAGASTQAQNAVAIGFSAGQTSQGQNAIAIGNLAGQSGQVPNSIAICATGTALNPTQAGFYVNPVRTAAVAANSITLTYSAANEIIVNSSKTFVIDHPLTPATDYLVHACLEGPEAGVYYRGQAKIEMGDSWTFVELPEYLAKLASDLTIQVTNIGHYETLMVLPVNPETPNGFMVQAKKTAALEDLDFYWLVLGKRQAITVKVPKLGGGAKIHGAGPYKWLE